jgi:hypothetical protein
VLVLNSVVEPVERSEEELVLALEPAVSSREALVVISELVLA